jgi:hypothetical protein
MPIPARFSFPRISSARPPGAWNALMPAASAFGFYKYSSSSAFSTARVHLDALDTIFAEKRAR